MKSKINIFDKLGTLIPGYNGYQEREGRRECDRQLRERIADLLYDTEKKLNSIIEDSDLNSISKMEKSRKKINNLKDLIRYSPYGASAFFSNSEIKESELEKIYRFDLTLLDLSGLLSGSVTDNNLLSVEQQLKIIDKTINERNHFIKDK